MGGYVGLRVFELPWIFVVVLRDAFRAEMVCSIFELKMHFNYTQDAFLTNEMYSFKLVSR